MLQGCEILSGTVAASLTCGWSSTGPPKWALHLLVALGLAGVPAQGGGGSAVSVVLVDGRMGLMIPSFSSSSSRDVSPALSGMIRPRLVVLASPRPREGTATRAGVAVPSHWDHRHQAG